MFYFEHPHAFWLLIALVGFWVWYFLWLDPRRLRLSLSFDPYRLLKTPWYHVLIPFLPNILISLALIAMITALARPRWQEGNKTVALQGLNVLLAFDTSKSMAVDDQKPTRLLAATQMAQRLIQARPNDNFGVMVFAQDAFSLVPLTHDHPFVLNELHNLSTDIMPNEGSALGNAIALSVNRLQTVPSKAKVVLLFSDGVQNTGQFDPINAAMAAAIDQIRIMTIRVGRKNMPVISQNAKYSRTTGKTVASTPDSLAWAEPDDQTLLKIAEMTQGKYFNAADAQSLDLILYALGQIPTDRSRDISLQEVKDLYYWWAIPAALLLMIAFTMIAAGWYNYFEL
jgi:Ca-activated chloride channel homolog